MTDVANKPMTSDIRHLMLELAKVVASDDQAFNSVITQVGVRGTGPTAEAFFVIKRGEQFLGSTVPLFDDGVSSSVDEVMGDLGVALWELKAFDPPPAAQAGPDGVIWVG